jgi:purine-binding chemotaxis protein CheW
METTTSAEAETVMENSHENIHGSDGMNQYLTFNVAGEQYGVDIMAVREIKGWTETTRLPGSPHCMRGVINLRGAIIPIFDLRVRFNMDQTEANARNVVVILAVGSRNIGVLVDAVSDILSASPEEIRPAPDSSEKIEKSYISGLISSQDRMVVLLDISKLLGGDANIDLSAVSTSPTENS